MGNALVWVTVLSSMVIAFNFSWLLDEGGSDD